MHHFRLSSHAMPVGHAVRNEQTCDETWLRQNLVEIVHLAALQLHARSEIFTLKDLVKTAKRFYRDQRLTDSLVAAVLTDACIEADMSSGALKLAA